MRYPLRVRVTCRWKNGDGLRCSCIGLTRDISTRGLYVFAADPPPPGTTVKLEILLPQPEEGTRVLCLRAEGHVARSERNSASSGFAVISDFTAFRRYQAAHRDQYVSD